MARPFQCTAGAEHGAAGWEDRLPEDASSSPPNVGLIAAGLTNRQIVSRWSSPRTAEGHVQNILDKLGSISRAQMVAWIVEHGLGAGPVHGQNA
jgi:DNA-binding NarL/FixJ family response regulator